MSRGSTPYGRPQPRQSNLPILAESFSVSTPCSPGRGRRRADLPRLGDLRDVQEAGLRRARADSRDSRGPSALSHGSAARAHWPGDPTIRTGSGRPPDPGQAPQDLGSGDPGTPTGRGARGTTAGGDRGRCGGDPAALEPEGMGSPASARAAPARNRHRLEVREPIRTRRPRTRGASRGCPGLTGPTGAPLAPAGEVLSLQAQGIERMSCRSAGSSGSCFTPGSRLTSSRHRESAA